MADICLRKLLRMAFCCSICSIVARAEMITLYNKTERDVFASMYRPVSLTNIDVQSVVPITIKNGDSVDIERPTDERVLGFSFSAKDLGNSIEADAFAKIAQANIHLISGDSLYFALDGPELKAYDTVEYEVVLPAVNKLKNVRNQILQFVTPSIVEYIRPIASYIKKTSEAVLDNPHKDEVAHVRIGNELCSEEQVYRKKRLLKVQSALEKLLGRSIDTRNVPTIAILGSGGGYRAMATLAGFNVGWNVIGLMDATAYIAGVSGSTFTIGQWMSSGFSVEQCKEALIAKMARGLWSVSINEFFLLAQGLLIKAAFEEQVTMIDLWAGLTGNALLENFGDNRYRLYLSQQAKTISDGAMPFPIYTAVRADEHASQDWYEFTPYEIGASWMGTNTRGMYVPTWSFNRMFKNGVSTNDAPEQPLASLLGICTSGGATKIASQISFFMQGKKIVPPFDQAIDAILNSIGNQRITTAEINNFTCDMKDSQLKNVKIINLADAGGHMNIPYPPLSDKRRAADIMIMVDASFDLPVDLPRITQYAKEKGLKIPVLAHENVEKYSVSIFKDDNDPTVPLVIYMPLISDTALLASVKGKPEFAEFITLLEGFDVAKCMLDGYCHTSNFEYTKEQVLQLSGLMEFHVRANEKKIIEAIAWKVAQLEKHTALGVAID